MQDWNTEDSVFCRSIWTGLFVYLIESNLEHFQKGFTDSSCHIEAKLSRDIWLTLTLRMDAKKKQRPACLELGATCPLDRRWERMLRETAGLL